jgi:hypothetical protein
MTIFASILIFSMKTCLSLPFTAYRMGKTGFTSKEVVSTAPPLSSFIKRLDWGCSICVHDLPYCAAQSQKICRQSRLFFASNVMHLYGLCSGMRFLRLSTKWSWVLPLKALLEFIRYLSSLNDAVLHLYTKVAGNTGILDVLCRMIAWPVYRKQH